MNTNILRSDCDLHLLLHVERTAPWILKTKTVDCRVALGNIGSEKSVFSTTDMQIGDVYLLVCTGSLQAM